MTEIKFSEIWNIAIKPYLEYELSKNSSFYVSDSTENNSEARRNIESWYNSARDSVKRDFMKDPKKLLDRHKIPACLYSAIVKVPLIKVLGGSAEKEGLANAGLALHASLSILFSFMVNSADAEYSQYLKNNGLQFPHGKNLDSREPYLVQTIKELCYAQRRKELSPLVLANVFFMVEAYNDSVYANGKK
jgi:hypothetical protein